MASDLNATVERVYRLKDEQLVLVMSGSRVGSVEEGDWVEVETVEGARSKRRVKTVAWGSAFNLENPPLTLILESPEDEEVREGSLVVGIAAP